MKLSAKLALSMGLLTLLIACMGGLGMWQMRSINNASSELSGHSIPAIVAADAINNASSEYRIAETRYIYAATNEVRAVQIRWLRTQETLIAEKQRVLADLLRTPQGKQFSREYQTYLKDWKQYENVHARLFQTLDRQGREAAVEMLDGESEAAYKQLCAAIDALVYGRVRLADQTSAEADATYAGAFAASAAIICLSVLTAACLTILMVRGVNRQLGKDPGDLAATAERVIRGDYDIDDGGARRGVYGHMVDMVAALKEHIEKARRESERAKEESEKAREAMIAAEAARRDAQAKRDGILEAADQLEKVAQIVSSASTQLAAQIEQSEHGAARQAERMTEAATAMQEMDSTVIEMAKSAEASAEMTGGARGQAREGAAVVREVVQSVQGVRDISLRLKDDMAELGRHAQDINRIMNVISDIADQTNLLALNAAIEAARAGDAGRGFAVVADEVRKLAEKTMASTTDVGEAIRAIQLSSGKSMEQVDKAVENVENVTQKALTSGQALEKIVGMVEGAADQVRAIATASEEQSAASEQITKSITGVNSIAGETAQTMHEAAGAVSELARQVRVLTGMIETMKRS